MSGPELQAKASLTACFTDCDYDPMPWCSQVCATHGGLSDYGQVCSANLTLCP